MPQLQSSFTRWREWFRFLALMASALAAAMLAGVGASIRRRLVPSTPRSSDPHSEDFERIAEAMASGDYCVLESLAASIPGFPNAPDPYLGQPWFHIAVELGDPAVVDWMIKMGADVQTAGPTGQRPLQIAARRDDDAAPILALLVAAGADINSHGPLGTTTLHEAAETGTPQAVEKLLALGADPFAPDLGDRPALAIDLARTAGRDDIVAILDAAMQRQGGPADAKTL